MAREMVQIVAELFLVVTFFIIIFQHSWKIEESREREELQPAELFPLSKLSSS